MNLVVDSANAVTAGQAVAMGYNAPAAGANPLKNLAGVEAPRVSGLAVINDRDETVPTVTSVVIASTPTHDTDTPADGTLDTYGVGAKIQVNLIYSERVVVDTSRGTPRLKIKMHANFGEKWAVYESGSDTHHQFTYTVVSGNSSSNGTTDAGIAVLANSLQLTGGTIRSAASGRDASLAHQGLGHSAANKVNGALDAQPPRFRIATVRDTALVIVFDENLDSTSRPAGSDFHVTATAADGTDRSIVVSQTAFDADLPTNLNLSLAGGGVGHGEVVTVSYTQPGSNFLKGADGNAVASFSHKPVTNNEIAVVLVTIDSVSKGSQSGSLDVRWTAAATGAEATDYDLRYYAGSEDPPAGREADWIEAAPGLPDPGTNTSVTISGLKANTAYRVQVRAKTSLDIGPWTASVGQTTAAAPSGNNAPRVLIEKPADAQGNICKVDTDPLGAPDRDETNEIVAVSNTLASYPQMTGRRGETSTWPSVCSGAGRFPPLFDDVDGDDLTFTAEPYLLPDNVRLHPTNAFFVTQQTNSQQGRMFFMGSAAFRRTVVWSKATATDTHGASITTNRIGFQLSAITDANGAPSLAATVDQNASTSREFSLVLPAATGGDRGSGDGQVFPYFYRLTGLPNGLVFDEATRTISGTPLETGTFTVTYTADDADVRGSAYLNPAHGDEAENAADVASDEFTITVAETPHIDLVRVVSAPTHDANGDGKNDTYGKDDKIVIDVEYSEPVDVKGTIGTANGVRLRLDVGRNDDDQTNSRKGIDLTGVHHGGKTLRFEYTVLTADNDPDGVWVQTHPDSGQLLFARGTATITRLGTTVDAEVNKSSVATGAALDGDGIPMTYVNGRLTAEGPKPESANVDGKRLLVVFDEDLAALSAADLEALQLHFGVQGVDGTGGNRNAWQHPSKVESHVNLNFLVLTLGVAARKNDVVTLSYKRFDHKGPLKDGEGNLAPAFVEFVVKNDTGGGTGAGGTLVSNTGQSHADSGGFVLDYALAFTAGSNSAGYKLTSVTVPYNTAAPPSSSHTISIHASNSSNRPGAPLGTLARGTVSSQTVTYTASGDGIDLTAGTTYFVVLDTHGGSPTSQVKLTTSGAEDAGAADGWSLADRILSRTWKGGSWTKSTSYSWQIAIDGSGPNTKDGPRPQSASVAGTELKIVFDGELDGVHYGVRGALSRSRPRTPDGDVQPGRDPGHGQDSATVSGTIRSRSRSPRRWTPGRVGQRVGTTHQIRRNAPAPERQHTPDGRVAVASTGFRIETVNDKPRSPELVAGRGGADAGQNPAGHRGGALLRRGAAPGLRCRRYRRLRRDAGHGPGHGPGDHHPGDGQRRRRRGQRGGADGGPGEGARRHEAVDVTCTEADALLRRTRHEPDPGPGRQRGGGVSTRTSTLDRRGWPARRRPARP